MPYTIWSNGRVIAETDLEQPLNMGARQGEVRLEPDGEQLRDFFLALWAHVQLIEEVVEREGVDMGESRPVTLADVQARLQPLRAIPEAQPAADAVERMFSLRLELRDGEGNVVPQDQPVSIFGADAFCSVRPGFDDRRLFTMLVPPRPPPLPE